MLRSLPACCLVLVAAALVCPSPLEGQLSLNPSPPAGPRFNPLTDPNASPALAFLYGLEAKFAEAVKTGGGAAFSSFFAPDGVTLANGKSPVVGRDAIAAEARWKPEDYQLTWTPQGGALSPAGDMGYTWGHYEGRSKDAHGNPVVTSGRYLTIWKKQPDNSWKVSLDASNDEPSTDCCSLP